MPDTPTAAAGLNVPGSPRTQAEREAQWGPYIQRMQQRSGMSRAGVGSSARSPRPPPFRERRRKSESGAGSCANLPESRECAQPRAGAPMPMHHPNGRAWSGGDANDIEGQGGGRSQVLKGADRGREWHDRAASNLPMLAWAPPLHHEMMDGRPLSPPPLADQLPCPSGGCARPPAPLFDLKTSRRAHPPPTSPLFFPDTPHRAQAGQSPRACARRPASGPLPAAQAAGQAGQRGWRQRRARGGDRRPGRLCARAGRADERPGQARVSESEKKKWWEDGGRKPPSHFV